MRAPKLLVKMFVPPPDAPPAFFRTLIWTFVYVAEGSRASRLYGEGIIQERHRHRYEVNNAYRDRLNKAGLVIAGTYTPARPSGHESRAGGDLVEIVELKDHPWFVAGQFHPELRSRPWEPHPLFAAFIQAALGHQARA